MDRPGWFLFLRSRSPLRINESHRLCRSNVYVYMNTIFFIEIQFTLYKFTTEKCTVQWFLVYSRDCTAIITV